jgi:hypothetical protein
MGGGELDERLFRWHSVSLKRLYHSIDGRYEENGNVFQKLFSLSNYLAILLRFSTFGREYE